MRSAAFTFPLFIVFALAVWLGQRQVISSDPDESINVILFGVAVFLGVGSLTALLSWGLWTRRWQSSNKGYQVAIRQGIWVGLLVAAITLLHVWQLLSWLAIGAMVLIFGGLEALLLLQPDTTPADDSKDAASTP